jgi:hypothetical protein
MTSFQSKVPTYASKDALTKPRNSYGSPIGGGAYFYPAFAYCNDIPSDPTIIQSRRAQLFKAASNAQRTYPTVSQASSSSGDNSTSVIVITLVISVLVAGVIAGSITAAAILNKGSAVPSTTSTSSQTVSLTSEITFTGLQFNPNYLDLNSNDSISLATKICSSYNQVLANISYGKLNNCNVIKNSLCIC